jgi:WD40 repeat protein
LRNKPIIFFAFANDKVDEAAYLRNLSAEMHGVRKALGEAVRNGLCEVIERTSATISDIIDVFQDPVYGSRIAIFHYGGHADGFRLLLESETGGNAAAHKEGLVPLLSRQLGLKLVFLNGCSSEAQTNDMLEAGISAVIGTSASINDELATRLAVRFYSGLAKGSGIEKSWSDAVDEVKMATGSGNTRALNWTGKVEQTDRFPWVIRFRPGAELTKSWNLPDTAGNPLFGIPDIPPGYHLPESPFLYLNRYERRHAEVFFGRAYYIRSLYNSINDEKAPPIIMFYGQSGVGKSSLLEAGLHPRLEASHTLVYLRRKEILGLSNTIKEGILEKCGFEIESPENTDNKKSEANSLADSLEQIASEISDDVKPEILKIIHKIRNPEVTQDKELPQQNIPESLKDAWNYCETKFKKPLLIVLDQVEEAYTRPNERLGNEVNDLFIEMKGLFGNPASLPLGKIILSYRKEYHPELEEYCKNYELPRSRVFLDHISKKDVYEVFEGFLSKPRLVSRYNLSIEEGLPEIIAADLEADKDSPLAPMLQILLTKMWIRAQKENPDNPQFTHKLYKELKTEGLAMDEFLQNQLFQLKAKLPEVYSNGFALDLLSFYCTANNTAAARTQKQLLDHYPDSEEIALKTLEVCKELYLLTDLGGDNKSAMLAHDTLAKSVAKFQQRSTQSVQQAKRVLFSKMEAVRAGSKFSTLDIWDLELIDSVIHYLPARSSEENALIATSRIEKDKKAKDKRKLLFAKRGIGLIAVVAGIVISVLLGISRQNERDSYISHKAAASFMDFSRDPSRALLLASEGFEMDMERSSPEIKRALANAFYASLNNKFSWYKPLLNTDEVFVMLKIHQGKRLLLPISESDHLHLISEETGNYVILEIPEEELEEDGFYNFIGEAGFSKDGTEVIAMCNNGTILIWSVEGKLTGKIKVPGLESFDISPHKQELMVTINNEDHTLVQVYNLQGKHIREFKVDHDVFLVSYSRTTEHLFLLSNLPSLSVIPDSETDEYLGDGIVHVSDSLGNIFHTIDSESGLIYNLIFSPSGQIAAVMHWNGNVSIFNPNGELLRKIPYSDSDKYTLNSLEFHPNDSAIVVTYRNKKALIYNLYNKKDSTVITADEIITFANFSPGGNWLLTGSSDNSATAWNMNTGEKYKLLGHKNDVTAGAFMSDENTIITTSLDGAVKSWKIRVYDDLMLKGHEGPVNSMDLHPSGNFLSTSGADSTLRIWDLNRNKEIHRLDFGEKGMWFSVFSESGDKILGVNKNSQAFIWEWPDKEPVYLNGHNEIIEWAWFLDENTVVTSALDSTARIWNTSGRNLKTLKPGGKLYSMAVSNSQKMIAVGSENGDIFLYDKNGDEMGVFEGHSKDVIYLDFSPDEKNLVSASKDGKAIIWDLVKNNQRVLDRIICAPYYDCSVNSAKFSNDGKYVVTTSSDRTARVWNVADGKLHVALSGHSDNINYAVFSPRDLMIVTVSDDHTVRLWNIDGAEIATYKGHTGAVWEANFENSMNKLYTCSEDGTVRVWLTPTGIYNWLSSSEYYKFFKESQVKIDH